MATRHRAVYELDGIVLTRYGHGLPLERIKVVEAGHPLPDAQGEQARGRFCMKFKNSSADDLLLCLLSGGGSSLLSLPVEGVSMHDLKKRYRWICFGAARRFRKSIRCASISPPVQGGRLAASCRAPVLALIISDVTGDDPTHIASGPCAPDPTTYSDALAILASYRINAPAAVMETLQAGAHGKLSETPKPGDAAFNQVENRVIATARGSLLAAKEYLRTQGIPAVILSDSITGRGARCRQGFAALVKEIRQHEQPWKPPVALISGGETTVTVARTVRTWGRTGGRNTEFLLSLAIELDGMEKIHALRLRYRWHRRHRKQCRRNYHAAFFATRKATRH